MLGGTGGVQHLPVTDLGGRPEEMRSPRFGLRQVWLAGRRTAERELQQRQTEMTVALFAAADTRDSEAEHTQQLREKPSTTGKLPTEKMGRGHRCVGEGGPGT